MTKKVVIVIVVILVILGIWYIGKKTAAPASENNGANQTTGEVGISASNTSDVSLDQDLSNVDTQMTGLSADTTAADQTGN